MNDSELRALYIKKSVEAYSKLQVITGKLPGQHRMMFKFDLTGRCAANVRVRQQLIRVNMSYLRSHSDDMVNDTAPHEVCHIFAEEPPTYTKGGVGHSKGWQKLMIALGLEPTRCHDYNSLSGSTPNESFGQQFRYACSCREHFISKRKHNSILLGRGRHCKSCKVNLVYKPYPKSVLSPTLS